MLDIVSAIYSMVANMVKLPDDENTPEKRVNKIFEAMDKVTSRNFPLTIINFVIIIMMIIRLMIILTVCIT